MKKITAIYICLMGFITLFYADNYEELTQNFTKGKAEIQSMSVITFGPEGILFVGDSHGGNVFALDLEDRTKNDSKAAFELANVDKKVAGLLGTTNDGVIIHDLAVNPISQNIYLAVSRADASQIGFWKLPNDIANATILLRINPEGEVSEVSLSDINHSKSVVPKVIAPGKQQWRKSDLRTEAITDIAYHDGKLYLTGLSNEEFASALRVINFPFKKSATHATVEVWHVAHGKSETESPIRTLLPYDIEGETQILAAYTCTPFVSFPASSIKEGKHVKVKTLAEFGFSNMPIDIITYSRDGKEYILMSNSSKALIKIDPADIPKQKEGLTEPLKSGEYAVGLKHSVLSRVGITQIDNLNEDYVLVLQRMPNGELSLRSYGNKWL